MICFRCCGPSDEEEELKQDVDEMVQTPRVNATNPGPCENERPAPRHGSSSSIVAKAFRFQELSVATDNFNQDCLLGEGGFGRVYKGYLHNTRQVVAVKQLDRNGLQGNREFLVEVLMLSLLHHPNLVSLIGYCADGDQRLLVYEFMPLGSLEDHLHDIPSNKEPLDWNTRMKIAAGAAKGVEYLHNKADRPVIYRDLKTSNILLDDEYFPKLSDFGLAKLGPVGDKTHVTTRVMGTYGYCAPEYAMSGKLTFKSDVYSFGVVFLEIITGRRAIDDLRPAEERNLVAWAHPLFKDRKNFPRMVDPLLRGQYPMRGLYQALAIAAMCVQEQAAARPVMRDVATAISYLASQTYDPNAPNNRVRSSTRRTKELQKSFSSISEIEYETISPNILLPVNGQTDLSLERNRGDHSRRGLDSVSVRRNELETLHIDRFQTDTTLIDVKQMRESLKNRKRDAARERAIAEAKQWGESWRERANEWIL